MEIELNLDKEKYYEFVSYINSGKPIYLQVTPTIQVKLEITTITSQWSGTNPSNFKINLFIFQDFSQELENGDD